LPWLRWARNATTAILLLVLLLLGLGFTRTGWDGIGRSLPWLVLIILWLAVLAGGYSWITAWQIKRNNPAMVSGQIHHISRQGYRVTCGPVTSQAEWAGLLRVVETQEFFLAFPVRNAAYFLPKRCLSSEGVETARALFGTHLGDRSLLLAV
jgi:hypothetical protein